jgi:hypothetical protein
VEKKKKKKKGGQVILQDGPKIDSSVQIIAVHLGFKRW